MHLNTGIFNRKASEPRRPILLTEPEAARLANNACPARESLLNIADRLARRSNAVLQADTDNATSPGGDGCVGGGNLGSPGQLTGRYDGWRKLDIIRFREMERTGEEIT